MRCLGKSAVTSSGRRSLTSGSSPRCVYMSQSKYSEYKYNTEPTLLLVMCPNYTDPSYAPERFDRSVSQHLILNIPTWILLKYNKLCCTFTFVMFISIIIMSQDLIWRKTCSVLDMCDKSPGSEEPTSQSSVGVCGFITRSSTTLHTHTHTTTP